MRLGVVLSSQFITNDLLSDFGYIVPSDLPISNQPLSEYQLDSLNDFCDDIIFTLPKGYASSWIKNEVIYCPHGLTLRDVIEFVISKTTFATEYVFYFGDTLLFMEYSESAIYIGEPRYHYPTWYYVDMANVFAGAFSIYRKDIVRLLSITETTNALLVELTKNLCNVFANEWYDFGNYSTYYNSRKRFLESRHFNSIKVSHDSMLTKYSNDYAKIFYEYFWLSHYTNLFPATCPTPKNFKLYRNGASYDIEYFALPSLSDLFVFGRKNESFWRDILQLCHKLIIKFRLSQVSSPNYSGFYSLKVKERLGWNGYKDLDLSEDFIQSQLSLALLLDSFDDVLVGGHGDFCFSNLLFDTRTSTLKVIDPRGFLSRDMGQSLLVPTHYDVFKLAHSLISGYDIIIASGKVPENDFPLINEFIDLFSLTDRVLFAGLSHLFFTMIPLHADRPDRQEAFAALTKRYYANYSTCG
jgi:hypothetical protein